VKRLIEWVPGHGTFRPARRESMPAARSQTRVGLLWNWRAVWIGWHHSKRDKRLCVNVVPFLTVWYVKPGGMLP
jgi:hypothetical protein